VSNGVNTVTTAPDFRLKAEAPGERGSATGRDESAALVLSRGYSGPGHVLTAGESGTHTIEVKQGERIELRTPRGFERAHQLGPGGETRPLPIGSTWDAASGTFYWQPAPAFLGTYHVVFVNGRERISVRLVVIP
jgi:hypothetical protein